MTDVSIKIENAEASFEITNLRYIDDIHFAFDICYKSCSCFFSTQFTELLDLRLLQIKRQGHLFDENHQERRLIFKRNEVCLEIENTEQIDDMVSVQCNFSLRTNDDKIEDCLLEFKAYLEVIARKNGGICK